jgi:hypothetical protein
MKEDNTSLLRTLREFRLRLMNMDPKIFSAVEGQEHLLVYEFGDRRFRPSEGGPDLGYGVTQYNDFQERTTERGEKKKGKKVRDARGAEDSEHSMSEDSIGELYGNESVYDWGGDFVGD